MRQKSFLSVSRMRMDLIWWTGRRFFVHTIQICLVASGYRWRDPEARCPRLTFDHRVCRHMLAHRHHNWNHQHWAHVLFADESIVSIYNCNGYVRVFVMLPKSYCIIAFKKQIEFTGMTTRVIEADRGLIAECRIRPVLMVPVLGPVCQHAATAVMTRSQARASVSMSWAISS